MIPAANSYDLERSLEKDYADFKDPLLMATGLLVQSWIRIAAHWRAEAERACPSFDAWNESYARLQALNEGLAARLARASEVLGQVAERKGVAGLLEEVVRLRGEVERLKASACNTCGGPGCERCGEQPEEAREAARYFGRASE